MLPSFTLMMNYPEFVFIKDDVPVIGDTPYNHHRRDFDRA